MAVLGLISALTLPSVFSSVSTAQMKAKQKEAVQVIQEVIYQGFLNGDFAAISSWGYQNTTDPIVQYFSGKLAGAIHCPKGNTTPPCTHNAENLGFNHGDNNHSARWVLPNGVGVWFNPPFVNASTIAWAIDGNMGNTQFDQALIIRCNIIDTNQTWVTSVPAKPGQCTARNDGWQPNFLALYR